MKIPQLNKAERNREYNLYSDEIIDSVVYHYLFRGLPTRDLDEKIIQTNETITGHISMNILHYLGLRPEFKGIFSKCSLEIAIEELGKSINDDYGEIVNCLRRYNLKNLVGNENKEDYELIEKVNTSLPTEPQNVRFKHKGVKKKKAEPITVNGRKVYPRDEKTSLNALNYANYTCEVDNKHPTFIRRTTNCNYTEPHHLIPLAFSDDFDVSLDVEENIVSLCSNCHNHLHYGRDIDEMLSSLYEQRKELLEKIDIKITYDQLKTYYK